MNKLIAIVLSFMLAFPAAAFAEEGNLDLGTFTILKEDQKAPFAGFLFDQSGIAKLLAETEFKLLELELKHDINFLCVAQWSPRKNIDNTIRWFVFRCSRNFFYNS